MAEVTFEDALAKLGTIIEELEGGELPLDEALKKYEEGIGLARSCQTRLEAAKKKIEIIVKSKNGSVTLEPFDPLGAEPKKKGKRKSNDELF
ncbi:MAG: exodeoxyribonuclease VII small subunit [Candidatus Omnitrophica bacterium]|nr:exodeoxyribonuclease VII small subunit [Candidatus Omnitrophota bacterium]